MKIRNEHIFALLAFFFHPTPKANLQNDKIDNFKGVALDDKYKNKNKHFFFYSYVIFFTSYQKIICNFVKNLFVSYLTYNQTKKLLSNEEL